MFYVYSQCKTIMDKIEPCTGLVPVSVKNTAEFLVEFNSPLSSDDKQVLDGYMSDNGYIFLREQ